MPIVLRVVGLVVGVSLVFTDLLILGIALSVLGSVVGFMALLVFLIQLGNPHPNQYGPDPLQQREVPRSLSENQCSNKISPPIGLTIH